MKDVTAFIDTDVTVIKGDLIIGSDAEDAEELSDIAALKILKEVRRKHHHSEKLCWTRSYGT